MNSRILCCILFLLPASLGVAAERPNVLMIAVDDLRPELGCYGAAGVRSPNIDRLASRGFVFDRAYVQQSVCCPSRVSLLSGLRPDSTGVLNNGTMLRDARPDVVSLPRHFNLHGYRTASLGKIYHHPQDDAAAWSEPVWRPFDISWGWRNYRRAENRRLVERLYAELPAKKREVFPLGRVKGPAFESSPLPDNVYPDGLTADMAIRTLGRLARRDEPFFLAVGFYKPHLPFACPQKYWEQYDPAEIELPRNNHPPANMPEVAFRDSVELRQYHGVPQDGPLADDEARRLIHGYRACVSYTDAQIGRLLDELARLGLDENTVVVLWGDHGWHLGEQGIWAKSTNFENAVRAPLVVVAPGFKPARQRLAALVEMVDVYPTLCELAGLPQPGHLEGTSFAPLLAEPTRRWKSAAFSQYPRPDRGPDRVLGVSMRTDRYRYTRWLSPHSRDEAAALELYDHQNDPAETVNVAAEADQQLLAELEQKWRAGWRGARPKANALAQVEDAEPEFVPLFNGRDLTGWDGRPGCWTVRDGAIHSTGKGKSRNWLIFRGSDVADFELRYKFRFQAGNSGVQVRSHDLGDWQVQGYQVEIAAKEEMGLWHHSLMSRDVPAENDRKHLATAGQKVVINRRGQKEVEQVGKPEEVQAAYRDDGWNEMTIIARGPRLIQKLNGVVLSDLTDHQADFSARRGVLALQDHGKGTLAAFKDLRIRHFLPSNASEYDDSDKHGSDKQDSDKHDSDKHDSDKHDSDKHDSDKQDSDKHDWDKHDWDKHDSDKADSAKGQADHGK